MSRRRATTERPLPTGWTVTDHVRVNGRILRAGAEFKAIEHGSPPDGRRRLVRCRFFRYVQTPTSSWIEAFDDNKHFRAFRLERVITVHRTERLRGAG